MNKIALFSDGSSEWLDLAALKIQNTRPADEVGEQVIPLSCWN